MDRIERYFFAMIAPCLVVLLGAAIWLMMMG